MYQTIKKFLNDGGKCLLIEDGKPVGVVLTMDEYEKLLVSEINSKPAEPVSANSIGEAMVKEIDHPGVSAEIGDIEAADDVTLEDLGIDELPY